ncbi:MAG TPA: hypothetical protein PKL54_04370 [Candidatus Hydrogenedentes bacterium]|nr:hypothetical protein [Candidatus Hydrogenedentota bacterium]HOC72023.1 hypothetical protein [Candidatus Hydrogenedentota bacterium]
MKRLEAVIAGMLLAAGTAWAAETSAPQPEKAVPALILVESHEFEMVDSAGSPCPGWGMREFAVSEGGKWREIEYGSPPSFARIGDLFQDLGAPGTGAAFSRICRANPCMSELDAMVLLPEKEAACPTVMVSRCAWRSQVRSGTPPPDLKPLAQRMRSDVQPLEEDAWVKQERSNATGAPWDPGKLKPPAPVESLAFELAPGTPAWFVTMRQEYDAQRKPDCGSDLANYWCAVVLQKGQKILWTAAWVATGEVKAPHCHQIIGVADLDGDGVTELVMRHQDYEGRTIHLFQFRNGVLEELFSTYDGC